LHWTSGTLAAAALCWLGWRSSAGTASACTLRWFTIGFAGYAAGQIAWDIQAALAIASFPSAADLFYLWLGPALCGGLMCEIRRSTRLPERWALNLDILSLSVAALTLVLALYLPKRGDLSPALLAVLAAYPVSLLAATCQGLIMIPALRLRSTRSLWLFLPSVAITAWSWMTWNRMVLEGTATDGAWFNISFSLAILTAGWAASDWRLESSDSMAWDRACAGILRLLPLISVVVSGGAGVATAVYPSMPHSVRSAILIGSVAVIVLAFIRQSLLVRERDQLLAAQRETLRSRALLGSVIDTVPIRIFWKDRQCRYLGCNELFARDAGLEHSADIVGKDDSEMIWSDRTAFLQADDRTVMESGHAKLGHEEPMATPDGRTFWVRSSKVPLREDGRVVGLLGIYEDITSIKLHERQLEHIAHYDALTAIPNRTLLADRLIQAMARTRRDHSWLGVCYLDLDGFKPINDLQGHAAGDRVLMETARRIGQTIRSDDTVARLGGDEFVVLLAGLDQPDEVTASLERLLAAIAQPIELNGNTCRVTASIGVTLFPQDDADADGLLRHADQAMYLAKQHGKNCYHCFDPDQDSRIRSQNHAVAAVRRALECRQFELHYQPIVDLRSNAVIAAEALIRWRHPRRGLLLPGEFLRTVERTSLERDLGQWVIDSALEQLDRWSAAGLLDSLSINLSGSHLLARGFAEDLQRGLTGRGSVVKLQIDIQETEAIADAPLLTQVMENCGQFGISFALDDFGAGCSSLNHLRDLPAQTFKINQYLVRDMLVDAADHACVQAIIGLARAFNRTTVAEGVETAEHYYALGEMGCDRAQGFGIAIPMDPVAFERWWENGRPMNFAAAPTTDGMVRSPI
ncbi:MAG: EAL domain-containing protein, partial [Methylococcaceae bacterium]|nr:EAL domain-containing protein [Methylococcaceae bacterium]